MLVLELELAEEEEVVDERGDEEDKAHCAYTFPFPLTFTFTGELALLPPAPQKAVPIRTPSITVALCLEPPLDPPREPVLDTLRELPPVSLRNCESPAPRLPADLRDVAGEVGVEKEEIGGKGLGERGGVCEGDDRFCFHDASTGAEDWKEVGGHVF